MKAVTGRQRAIAKALTILLPMAPYSDIEAVTEMARARHMRDLPPPIAVWMATIAYVRHKYTPYDTMLDDGYDREAARHFVVDDINQTLTKWRATRLLKPGLDEED